MSEQTIYILIGLFFNILLITLLILAWRLLSSARPHRERPKTKPAKQQRRARRSPTAAAATPPAATPGVRLEGLFQFDSRLDRPLADSDVGTPSSEAASSNGRVDRMAR